MISHRKPTYDTRTAVANRVDRWNQILDEMGRTFATAERRRPFGEVRRPEITAAGLNAVAAHPLYGRFWRVGWEALRRGLYRLDPEDRMPLSPTWELYERWCFVALARKLREWLPGLRVEEQRVGPNPIVDGSPARRGEWKPHHASLAADLRTTPKDTRA